MPLRTLTLDGLLVEGTHVGEQLLKSTDAHWRRLGNAMTLSLISTAQFDDRQDVGKYRQIFAQS